MIEIHQCPACGGEIQFRFEVPFEDLTMKVHQCGACQCYVKSPFFDAKELAGIYRHYDLHEKHYELSDGEIHNLRLRLERIEKVLGKKGGKLLEIGCGRGHLLREAIRAGWDAEGIEFEGSSQKQLLEGLDGKIRFIKSESDFAAISKNTYDVICSYQVFEHLTEPLKSLGFWTQGLRKGGLMVIQTPHARSLGARLHGPRWMGHQRKEHFMIFSYQAFQKMFQSLGLRILKTDLSGAPFIFTGEFSNPVKNKSVSIVSLFRFAWLSDLARRIIHGLGLGDGIEIFGVRESFLS